MNRLRTIVMIAGLLMGVLLLSGFRASPLPDGGAIPTGDEMPAMQADAGEPVQVSPDAKGYRFDRNGWIYVHIEGDPYERGFQHGYLVAPELKEILRTREYMTFQETGMPWDFFVEEAVNQWEKHLEPEFLDEIKGIADGAQAAGTDITWQEVLGWNGHFDLLDYWWAQEQGEWYKQYKADHEHCSAFMATGDWTTDGRIVMAHNNWDGFVNGQFANLVLDIAPAEGNHIFMQSTPGFIHSGTDFFITDAGLMGLETTIGGFSQYDADGAPEFLRIRRAMQYGESLDDFLTYMLTDNNGGYANSWLVGDRNSGEIMRLELGLKFHKIERTDNGYFVGFNSATDPRIRNFETKDRGYADIRSAAGARRVRLTQLMAENKGKIDVAVAQEILADHYDPFLQIEQPGWRTIDGHVELDDMRYVSALSGRPAFNPSGAVDGKVTDSELAKEWTLSLRFGNSSGLPFDAAAYLTAHLQFDYLEGYLKDRPTQPWTLFVAGENAPEAE